MVCQHSAVEMHVFMLSKSTILCPFFSRGGAVYCYVECIIIIIITLSSSSEFAGKKFAASHFVDWSIRGDR